MNTAPALVWFRLDLRLADQPALHAATQRRGPILPVFIWAPEEEAPWEPGAASCWWLHHSLHALDEQLRKRASRLILRRGPTWPAFQQLIKETGARALFWNRRYEPAVRARDQQILERAQEAGLEVKTFCGGLLREPDEIRNKSGKPFQVFSPFWRQYLALPDPTPPLPVPRRWPSPQNWPSSLCLDELELLPKIPWDAGFHPCWQPGSEGVEKNLKQFLQNGLARYEEERDFPAHPGTSRLSPHLHHGEISPRQVWHAVTEAARQSRQPALGKKGPYLRQLIWREFAHHLLVHFPHTPLEPLRPEFKRFPWSRKYESLRAWQQGRTGYPMVDAGMRQLWTTGWMHNRVRLLVASFLVKHLLMPWTDGARWFWDTLVDADLANNTLGWQWTAGCGADAAPYFRIFNPMTQGEKFDPQGEYIRRWIPELAQLPDQWLFAPWTAPAEELARAGVELGRTYPEPIVNHTIAREVALEAFEKIRKRD